MPPDESWSAPPNDVFYNGLTFWLRHSSSIQRTVPLKWTFEASFKCLWKLDKYNQTASHISAFIVINEGMSICLSKVRMAEEQKVIQVCFSSVGFQRTWVVHNTHSGAELLNLGWRGLISIMNDMESEVLYRFCIEKEGAYSHGSHLFGIVNDTIFSTCRIIMYYSSKSHFLWC